MVSKLAKFLMQIYRKISENFALISLMAKNNAELTQELLKFMYEMKVIPKEKFNELFNTLEKLKENYEKIAEELKPFKSDKDEDI